MRLSKVYRSSRSWRVQWAALHQRKELSRSGTRPGKPTSSTQASSGFAEAPRQRSISLNAASSEATLAKTEMP